MTDSTPLVPRRFQLANVAFFGRTLGEYLGMFSLEMEALRGLRILDVASGPGSFVAEALARGIDATGCDPMYAEEADMVAAQGKADIDSCREQIRRNPGVLVYRDIDGFYAEKYAALETFVADFRRRRGEGRYVAGSLPNLPFEDRRYDLVLSANFLFVYAPLADGGMHAGRAFGPEFHEAAFGELARVAGREVRVAGMHTWTQPPQPHPYRELVTRVLEHQGFEVECVRSDYDDGCRSGRGDDANDVLVARRR